MELFVVLSISGDSREVVKITDDKQVAAKAAADDLSRRPNRRQEVLATTSIELSPNAMAGVSYDYEWTLTEALAKRRMEERGLKVEGPSALSLLDKIASYINKNVNDYGCDEDWSVDEAFKEYAAEFNALLAQQPVDVE